MKNKQEHLAYCVGEECGEVQQVLGKIGRFGLLNTNPNNGLTNLQQLKLEVHDIIAVYQMLTEEVGEDPSIDDTLIAAKMKRTEHYMEVARNLGELEKKDEH